MTYLLQQVLNAAQLGSIYALIALGYTMVYGILTMINFAHGDLFMVGAFFCFLAATFLKLPFIPTLLVSMLEREPEWKNIPLLNAFAAQSFIALPLPVTEDRSLALLAIGTDPLPEFTAEDRQSYARLIRQVTISLQNLELLTETRRRLNEMNLLLDFSRKLGSLSLEEPDAPETAQEQSQ